MWVLAHIEEDNSYEIVEESDVICDSETVAVQDKVSIMSRCRNTGKMKRYYGVVLKISDDFDELVEEQKSLQSVDKKKKKVTAETELSSSDEDLLKTIVMGRGKRQRKVKNFDTFTDSSASSTLTAEVSKPRNVDKKSSNKKAKKTSICTQEKEKADMKRKQEVSTAIQLAAMERSFAKSSDIPTAVVQENSNPDDDLLPLSCLLKGGGSNSLSTVKPRDEKDVADSATSVSSSPTKEELKSMLAEDRATLRCQQLQLFPSDHHKKQEHNMKLPEVSEHRVDEGEGPKGVEAELGSCTSERDAANLGLQKPPSASASLNTAGRVLLRFKASDPDVVDIGSGTFCHKSALKNLNKCSTESAVARALLVSVFSDHALTTCSLEGNAVRGAGKFELKEELGIGEESQDQELLARTELPEVQREALLVYAERFAADPGHTIKPMSKSEVKRSLGSKLSELRQKYKRMKKEKLAKKSTTTK